MNKDWILFPIEFNEASSVSEEASSVSEHVQHQQVNFELGSKNNLLNC